MKIIPLIFGGLLLGATQVKAQETPKDLNTLPIVSQPLPTGDLLSQAPTSAHWTITSSLTTTAATPAGAAPSAPKATITNLTKSAKLYLVESVGPDGKKVTRWKDRQYQATYLPGQERPLVEYSPTIFPDGSVLYYMDFTKSDFPEVSWISAQNYVGMTKMGSATGMVFKASVKTKGTQMILLSETHPNPTNAIAVVDLQTRLPLMLQVNNELLTYQFASGGEVTLPKEVQEAFNAWRKQIQRSSVVPPG